jgi:hypothetical protein
MAFGSGSRSFGPNSVLYSFKIKTKDLPAPIFEVSKKGEDGKYAVLKGKDATAQRVSGNLIDARLKEHTHNGELIKSLNLTIQDGDDVYFVSVGYTFLGRNLFNALLALKSFDDIEIGLYQSKPKPDAVDKRGFASVALRQHNELVRGLFDPKKDLPPIPKVKLKGKDVSDTGAIDEFFEEKLKGFCKVVNAAAPKRVTASAPAAQETASEPSSEGAEGGEEVPDNTPPF